MSGELDKGGLDPVGLKAAAEYIRDRRDWEHQVDSVELARGAITAYLAALPGDGWRGEVRYFITGSDDLANALEGFLNPDSRRAA